MDIILSSMMILKVVFADPEGDGTYNYLLERTHSATERAYSIAYSSDSEIGWKPSDTVYAYVEARCQEVWALDPTDKSAFPWGVPRKAYVCNADSITINNVTYKSTRK